MSVIPSRTGAALAAACALAVIVGCGGDDSTGSALRFHTAPYLGVSCPRSNFVACDRVGVAVRLRPDEPAERLEAWLNGREVTMTGRRIAMAVAPQEEGERSHRVWPARRTWVFDGFIEDVGLDGGPLAVRPRPDGRWLGVPPVRGKLRVVAHYPDGRAATRTVTVHLSPGWG